jgi:AraC-like DNA-binding protein
MNHRHFLHIISEAIGSPVKNGVIEIPPDMGVGFLRAVQVTDKLNIIIRNYELEFPWRQKPLNRDKKVLLIAFHHILSGGLPSAQITTLEEIHIPANEKISSVIILIHADFLKEMLCYPSDTFDTSYASHISYPTHSSDFSASDSLLQAITSGDQSFFLEELLSPRIQDVAKEMVNAQPPLPLQSLFFRAKAEELIYLLIAELLKRNEPAFGSINIEDAKMIYQVKGKLLATLETAPQMSELTKFAGMSESKLQRLFKQVFGSTIYNYYQCFRMKAAAQLIREEGLSISEAGYRMGFSNLSHFTRLFESHIGVKPKKYAQAKSRE